MTAFGIILALIFGWITWSFVKSYKAKAAQKARQELLSRLQAAHDSKDYAEVIRLTEGIDLDQANLCWVVGNALIQTGAIEKGRSVFRKAFFYGDKNSTRKMFGYSELNAGNFNEAVSLLQEIEGDWLANEIKYDDGYDIIENTGRAFIGLGRYDLAIESLKKAPLQKKNITPGLYRIFVLLAETYEQTSDPKNALKFYRKAAAYRYSDELQKKISQLAPEE